LASQEPRSRRLCRAGLPRLHRDDRRFLPLPISRPERAVLSGERGLANAVRKRRTSLGLAEPMLREIKNACHPQHVERLRGWLAEAGQVARTRLLDVAAKLPAPTILVPVDQVQEPGLPDEGQRGNGRHHLRDARNRADDPVPLSGRYRRERLSP
jgi:hypothetical protein